MTALLQDLRYAVRTLRNNLGFTAVAVLTLALGIGANTAIFQLLDSIRLTALPLKKPNQLAEVRIIQPHGRTGNFTSSHPDLTYPQWEQIRTQQQGRHHLEPDERVIATSILGGLHHEYALERSAA